MTDTENSHTVIYNNNPYDDRQLRELADENRERNILNMLSQLDFDDYEEYLKGLGLPKLKR